MAKINEKTNPLVETYQKIRELSVYGKNAVLRRALNILGESIQNHGNSTEIANIPASNYDCGPNSGCFDFTIADAINEFQQDDRRRSIFLDPEESYVANLADFYSGRLNVLEVRYLGDFSIFEGLEQKAIEYLKGREPVVKVNHLLASSDQEVVEMLRALADNLEKGIHQQNAEILIKENTEEALLRAESCSYARTEVVGSRIVNGRELQYLYREIIGCRTRDACCSNQTYTERVGREWWQTVKVGGACKVSGCGCQAFSAAGSQDHCIGRNAAGGTCNHQIAQH